MKAASCHTDRDGTLKKILLTFIIIKTNFYCIAQPLAQAILQVAW